MEDKDWGNSKMTYSPTLGSGAGAAGVGDLLPIGLLWEAPPERGTFFSLQVYRRVGIALVEVYERVAKSARCILWL